MPSPIAHLSVGYALSRLTPPLDPRPVSPFPRLAGIAFLLGASLLPDADAALGVLAGDLGRFHNHLTHSIVVGLAFAASVRWLAALVRVPQPGSWARLGFLAFCLHLLMDSLTSGRGVMLLWPFSSRRFLSPFPLFYGLRWSQGLFSPRHLITASTELLFALPVIFLAHRLSRRRPSAKL